MIQTNELRIGNWVIDPGENKMVEVDGISTHGYIKSYNNRYDAGYKNVDPEPIPLTPEILEKAGFKNSITGTCRGMITQDGKLRLSIFEDGRVKISTEDLPNKITFVHQLQNLYHSLTGTELQISL